MAEADLSGPFPEWTRSRWMFRRRGCGRCNWSRNFGCARGRGGGRELARETGRGAGGGGLPDAVIYEGAEDLFRTAEFHAGEFELQDISSQIVGWICDPQPGETWWDACAGEGGKTLHLCDLMRGKGLVWASDRAAWRLQKLKRERAARARVFNYRAALWDGGRETADENEVRRNPGGCAVQRRRGRGNGIRTRAGRRRRRTWGTERSRKSDCWRMWSPP